jgi:hypothetical protein
MKSTTITFVTSDPDIDEWLAQFNGLLNTADNEEGAIIHAQFVYREDNE